MSKFKVIFYETETGACPIEDFLSSLDLKMRVKLIGLLEILEEKGPFLREPYSKHLEDGIFELRCKQGNSLTRVLYFFYCGGTIVLTNGFVKKTQKTPRKELKSAKLRRTDYLKRIRKDENS